MMSFLFSRCSLRKPWFSIDMEKKCIYFTRFKPDSNTDGGSRRAAQICNAFSFLSPLVSSALSLTFSPKSIKTKLIEFFEKKYWNDRALWHETFQPSIDFFYLVSREWIISILEKQPIDIALVDDPIYFPQLIQALINKKIPVIAFTQNLESLVPGQIIPERQKKLFNKEIAILSKCDLVVTISREDNALLNNFGINTFFLPYYPDEENLRRLQKIRLKREKTIKKGVLLMGSAGNRPTAMGMVTAIENWEKYNLNRSIGNLIIAGYHTESLKNLIAPYNVELLGSVSPEKLDHLLENVKAGLCYQERGSGTLTRIMDMLIAGVPVMANTHAARSYCNLPGIYEFSSFEHIVNDLQDREFCEKVPPLPIPYPYHQSLRCLVADL